MNGFFDAAVCAAATLADISTEKVRRFLIIARQAHGFPLAENTAMPGVLEELRLIRQGRPTNAAVLLFGHEPQRFLSSSGIDCTHFPAAIASGPAESDQACQGTLFEMVDQAMYFVLSRMPGAESGSPIPVEVVREAIVNAVAHRDYAGSGKVEVRLFSDRLEVFNPGSLPPALTLEQLRQPHRSAPANPLLAEPLYLTTYRLSRGTGTADMIARCRKAGLPEPEFKLEDGFLVILRYGPVGGEGAGEAAGEAAPPAAPVDPQVSALVRLLGKAGPLGNADILDRLGLKDRVNLHKRYLSPALEAGLIEQTIPDKPNSRSQRYRLTAKGKALLKS